MVEQASTPWEHDAVGRLYGKRDFGYGFRRIGQRRRRGRLPRRTAVMSALLLPMPLPTGMGLDMDTSADEFGNSGGLLPTCDSVSATAWRVLGRWSTPCIYPIGGSPMWSRRP